MAKKITLPTLPSLPSANRPKALKGCACGCGGTTQATFVPGHDSKLKGWVLRVELKVITIDELNDWPGIKAQVARVVAMRASGRNVTFMRNVPLPEQPEVTNEEANEESQAS